MHPDLRYYERYRDLVDDWAAFRASLAAPLPVAFWTNPLRTTTERLVAALTEETGVAPAPLPWAPGAFRWTDEASKPGRTLTYAMGHYAVQEEAALLPVRLLDPRPDERILDLCAAPGNKTAQMDLAMD